MLHLILALALSTQSTTPPSISLAPALPDNTKPNYRANGSPTCPAWRSARAGKDEDSQINAGIHRNWVLGYITGFNFAGPDQTGNILGTASGKEFYAAIDGYCGRNPSHLVAEAMHPIVAAIIRRRGIPAITPSKTDAKKQATIVAPYTCRDWIRDSDNRILRFAYVVVLNGYITAYNQWGPDPVGDAIGVEDQSLIEKAADKWCGEHPSGFLIGTVKPLLDDVAAERAAGRLPPGGIRPTDEARRNVPAKR